MRICLFHSTLPAPDRKLGGVEVFVHRLANHLVARGHAVTVATLAPEPPTDATYRVVRIGSPVLADRKVLRWSIVPLLLHRLDQSAFDVIHFNGDDWFFLARRVPTLRTFYGSALFEAQSATRLRRRSTQLALFPLEVLAGRLATECRHIGPQLPKAYRPMESLPLAVQAPLAGGQARSPVPTLLFVGTWHGRKRGAWLAELFTREVLPALPNAQLWMVSDRCNETASVRWMRFPSDRVLSGLYRRAWVFCLPSTYEGFGLPYLEAMAHGLPVVATPNPGAEYVLQGGDAGDIVAEDHLARHLTTLLQSVGRRESLTTLGLRRAAAFDWNTVVTAHEDAYLRAIDRFNGTYAATDP